ncbi:hypothetical protein ONA91_04460 [Micromonospora sp. DR5-3]|uniref:hypothetical protein n=1 Tax=unclassified Micromonospora TaxID=2617518 RepID=UPI0011DBCA7C|nr:MULTISPECIES: hypothetical protein [unclassified Micromonospora]MCW3813711.1 hypothetical protein [Micromonospora sp. DR5-3]TYC25597.1 hypothetical protein FXF52_04030 [Micromonospora sp. MP36]
MPTSIGDLVEPDWTIPAWVLDDPACPPAVREAFAALDAANAETSAERDKVDAIGDTLAANRAAIAAAIRDGRKVPAAIPQDVAEEQTRQGEMRVRAARNRAYAAVKAAEAVTPEHHEALRPILAARVPEAAATSARAFREARQAYQEAEALTQAIVSLDNVRRMRRSATPEQMAAIDRRARAIRQADPVNYPGRSVRLPLAWQDIEAVATGIPADRIVVDPYAEGA